MNRPTLVFASKIKRIMYINRDRINSSIGKRGSREGVDKSGRFRWVSGGCVN